MNNNPEPEKPPVLKFSPEETALYIQQIVGAQMIKNFFSHIVRQEINAKND